MTMCKDLVMDYLDSLEVCPIAHPISLLNCDALYCKLHPEICVFQGRIFYYLNFIFTPSASLFWVLQDWVPSRVGTLIKTVSGRYMIVEQFNFIFVILADCWVARPPVRSSLTNNWVLL